MHLTSEELSNKIFFWEGDFTPEEISQMVGLLGLTKEETEIIFYS